MTSGREAVVTMANKDNLIVTMAVYENCLQYLLSPAFCLFQSLRIVGLGSKLRLSFGFCISSKTGGLVDGSTSYDFLPNGYVAKWSLIPLFRCFQELASGIQLAYADSRRYSYCHCCITWIPTAFQNVQLPNTLLSCRPWEFLLLR